MKFWKCTSCKLAYLDEDLNEDKTCKKCGAKLTESCENDNIGCTHDISSGIKVCDKCGKFMCPICGSHDVEVLSRVTGYYSPVNAWCAGKQQELMDRKRYEV
jgi:hypothetical protein